jgi:hypothetical protein
MCLLCNDPKMTSSADMGRKILAQLEILANVNYLLAHT